MTDILSTLLSFDPRIVNDSLMYSSKYNWHFILKISSKVLEASIILALELMFSRR